MLCVLSMNFEPFQELNIILMLQSVRVHATKLVYCWYCMEESSRAQMLENSCEQASFLHYLTAKHTTFYDQLLFLVNHVLCCACLKSTAMAYLWLSAPCDRSAYKLCFSLQRPLLYL
jgi:hypothetical protein